MDDLVKMRENFWKNKNVLVTGAMGFVGSWITKSLIENGANVIALDKTPRKDNLITDFGKVKMSDADLTNYSSLVNVFNENRVELVFHLAAQAIVSVANDSPLSTFETNIKGTWSILEAVRKSESVSGIVVASSDKAYGSNDKLPYKEEYPLNGLHPYDASKSCADILARTYFETYNLPVVVTRCANIYGGGDMNFSRIVPDTMRSVLQNKNPIIRSDGTPVRDYLYISDAVSAYLLSAENIVEDGVKGQAFNFGTNNPITVLELVKRIIEISGKKKLEPVILGKGKTEGEIQAQYLSSEKSKKLLGWSAKTKLEDGLQKTFEWYKSYFQR